MMRFKGCLLASDVDGTLMEQGYINPRNFEAINYFVKQGGLFCIATGRSPAAMKHIVSKFCCLHNVIYYNGGMIYDYTNKNVLLSETLSDCDKEFFKRLTDKNPELCMEVYSGEKVFVVRASEECRAHFRYQHIDFVSSEYERVKTLPWNKAMTYYLKEYDDSTIEKEIINFNSGSCEFIKAAGYIDGKHYCGYEQLPFGVNKGTALTALADILCLNKNKIFAIGDYYNDYEMLKMAGVSACPQESPKEIKDIVDFVGSACRDGAVADFIEYLNKAIV